MKIIKIPNKITTHFAISDIIIRFSFKKSDLLKDNSWPHVAHLVYTRPNYAKRQLQALRISSFSVLLRWLRLETSMTKVVNLKTRAHKIAVH